MHKTTRMYTPEACMLVSNIITSSCCNNDFSRFNTFYLAFVFVEDHLIFFSHSEEMLGRLYLNLSTNSISSMEFDESQPTFLIPRILNFPFSPRLMIPPVSSLSSMNRDDFPLICFENTLSRINL